MTDKRDDEVISAAHTAQVAANETAALAKSVTFRLAAAIDASKSKRRTRTSFVSLDNWDPRRDSVI